MDARLEGRHVDHQRIDLHQHRAIGRQRLDHAGDRRRLQRLVEGEAEGIDRVVDLGAELDRHRRVATRQEAGKGAMLRHDIPQEFAAGP